MNYQATRHHDISCGHRVAGHEGKCRFLHGHNYRIYFTCEAIDLDDVGRVIDFSAMKDRLCEWLEEHWDHKFLVWEDDPLYHSLYNVAGPSMVSVPFNPTAENIARHLVVVVGPRQLEGTGVRLVSVTVQETSKCSASYGI